MRLHKFIIFASCILFIAIVLSHINNDFWQDEIYTLVHFVFTPFSTTLFDYHVANNHILFNFLLNIERQLLGINDIKEVLFHPFYVRVIPFIISIIGIVVFYVAMKKLYGNKFALIALSVYVTTFSLINFSVQLRGYALNVLLCTILVYYFIKSFKEQYFSNTHFLKLLFATLLVVVCLPVNIYLISAMVMLPILLLIKPTLSPYISNNYLPKIVLLKIIFSLIGGASFAAALYVWLFSKHQPVETTLPVTYFAKGNLLQSLAVFFHFTHTRLHFYILLIAFAFMLYRSKHKKIFFSNAFIISVSIYLLYFIFCFIHGAVIIQRIFLSLIPVFAIIITAVVEKVFEENFFQTKLSIFLSLNFLCVIISIAMANTTAKKNNEQSVYTHDLINQYYLINFNAKESVLLADKMMKEKKIPLFVEEGFGDSGIADYLKIFTIPFAYFEAVQATNYQAFAIISNNKKRTENFLISHGYTYQKQMSSSFHYNVYYCYKK
ncbi:MAG: hypothetical protein KF781_09200 [Chitinophagaceae bacterium]|nr:hypothetical protein [Chitinophagaceae bacterium]MCW5905007.1 hypothetical protein [Chitinophagaceae bacterium]